jgi:hypothetical protein
VGERILSTVGTIAAFVMLWFAFMWWNNYQVVSHALEQYDIVKRSGNQIEKCVGAQTVVAAQLYAKHEDDWKKWKAVEASECAYLR